MAAKGALLLSHTRVYGCLTGKSAPMLSLTDQKQSGADSQRSLQFQCEGRYGHQLIYRQRNCHTEGNQA